MYVAAAGMVVVVQGSMEMMALSVWGGGVLLWYFGSRGEIWVVVCLEHFLRIYVRIGGIIWDSICKSVWSKCG